MFHALLPSWMQVVLTLLAFFPHSLLNSYTNPPTQWPLLHYMCFTFFMLHSILCIFHRIFKELLATLTTEPRILNQTGDILQISCVGGFGSNSHMYKINGTANINAVRAAAEKGMQFYSWLHHKLIYLEYYNLLRTVILMYL